jgi:hypothetical protein
MWPFWRRLLLLLFIGLFVAATAPLLFVRNHLIGLLIGLAGAAWSFAEIVTSWKRNYPLGRLTLYACSCSTLRGRILSLHFRPQLASRVEELGLLEGAEDDCKVLSNWFGFSLRHRVNIYLITPDGVEGSLFEVARNGLAWPQFDALVIPLAAESRQLLRHELVHLFGRRLGAPSPPLKTEGLAVFFQCDGATPTLDERAREIAAESGVSVLLQPRFFHSDQRSAYALAGSFTYFLIKQFGWAAYREFYRSAHAHNFQSEFGRFFGTTLSRAENDWKKSLAGNSEEKKGREKGSSAN